MTNDISCKIPVVIPSFEPDESLINVCRDLLAADLRHVVVVDDGSGTSYRHFFDEVEGMGCTVLRNAVNMGKGRALKHAFNYILNNFPDAIGCVTADSDGQHLTKDIKSCILELNEHPNDLVMGCRDFSGEHVPRKSKFGNNLTKRICKFLCGLNLSDTQTGLRGIPCAFMKTLLNVPGERFEFETRMLIACKDTVNIREIKIETVYDSKENHKTHFDPVKDSLRIYRIFGGIFAKYIFSSLSSCVIDLLLFHLFCTVLQPLSAAFYVAIATVGARVISSVYNCIVNYKLVFQSHKGKSSAFKYFALVIVQMCASAALTSWGVYLLSAVPEVWIKLIVDTFLFFTSFYVQRRFIF